MAASQNGIKRLIVCVDGTWMSSDQWDQTPSNVTRLCRAIRSTSNSGIEQIVYYQSGVGTGATWYDHTFGAALGRGVMEGIRAAYGFLANNYCDGDEIFVAGFSRGAFIARSLCGIIGDVGLLTKRGMEDFYKVFNDYQHSYDKGYPDSVKKPEYEQNMVAAGKTRGGIKIKACCVWDTVGSLGIPQSGFVGILPLPRYVKEYSFHDTGLSDKVENAFHAMALTEHRGPFVPTLWEDPDNKRTATNFKQCWFPGAHTNIGGGYEDTGVADTSLLWMMDQLGSMLDFEPDYVQHMYDLNQAYYKKKGLKKAWGEGRTYNELSIGGAAAGGSANRTPGMYNRVDPDTGYGSDKKLVNTHEYMHASVRIRWGRKGLGKEDSGTFFPAGMYYWTKEGKGNGNVKWKGDSKYAPGVEIMEEKLGPLEMKLLELFETGENKGNKAKVLSE